MQLFFPKAGKKIAIFPVKANVSSETKLVLRVLRVHWVICRKTLLIVSRVEQLFRLYVWMQHLSRQGAVPKTNKGWKTAKLEQFSCLPAEKVKKNVYKGERQKNMQSGDFFSLSLFGNIRGVRTKVETGRLGKHQRTFALLLRDRASGLVTLYCILIKCSVGGRWCNRNRRNTYRVHLYTRTVWPNWRGEVQCT